MIEFDFQSNTYVCPFCGHAQAYINSYRGDETGFCANRYDIPPAYRESSFSIYTLRCNNTACRRIAVTAINRISGKQIDLVPQVVMRCYPDYIPEQIRRDYTEANMILKASPKAAATLLRRCLQGMIRDFWSVKKENLYTEINAIQDKVTPSQWKALDGLRKIGNIGAHMEQDVNLIIDIDAGEAKKLLRLIEMLLEKWYIARHDEEALCVDISAIADKKALQRKAK